MWKRLNNPKGAGQAPVTSPVETSFVEDEKSYLGTNGLGISNHTQLPTARSRPPPRPRREDEMLPKGLPRLPL